MKDVLQLIIDKVINKLKYQGYRMTPQRRTILEVIFSSTAPMTVSEIWEKVRCQYCDIGLDTIYRNINVLVRLECLIPIEGVGKNGARYELSDGHHHHITCITCGATSCVRGCPVNTGFVEEIIQQGYQLVKHKIELYGLCANCRK